MASEWPPAPPEGYRLDDPEYEQPWYVTLFLLGWLVGAYVGTPTLVIGVHGLDVVAGISREVIPQDGWEWMIYIGEVLTVIAIFAVAHESLHALAGRWLGLRTKFAFEYRNPLSWSPQVLTYGGFQSSRESLVISLVPLVVLTPVSIVVLVVGQQFWVIAAAALVTLANSAGSIGDLASAALFWHLPDGELIYHDREERRQYYAPKA
jgi:hypothetical protein